MGLFSNRRTALERRRRKLDRELTTIQEDLRAAGGGSDRPDEPGEFGDGQRMDPESGEGVRDSRFARYFANSFERVRGFPTTRTTIVVPSGADRADKSVEGGSSDMGRPTFSWIELGFAL